MVLEGKTAKILYKLGKLYTFKIAGTPTVTDSFYKDQTNTYTEIEARAVIFPSRAYDIHSHVLHYEKMTGVESVGIIDVFVDQANCLIDVEDYVKVGTLWFKLVSKEIFGDAYYIFEGQLEAEP